MLKTLSSVADHRAWARRAVWTLPALAVVLAVGCIDAGGSETAAQVTIDEEFAAQAFQDTLAEARREQRIPAFGMLLSTTEAAATGGEESALALDFFCLTPDNCKVAEGATALPDLPPARGQVVALDDVTLLALDTNSICIMGYRNGRRVIQYAWPNEEACQ